MTFISQSNVVIIGCMIPWKIFFSAITQECKLLKVRTLPQDQNHIFLIQPNVKEKQDDGKDFKMF